MQLESAVLLWKTNRNGGLCRKFRRTILVTHVKRQPLLLGPAELVHGHDQ